MKRKLTPMELAQRTITEIAGDVYFSKLQWKQLRDHDRDRTFARLESGEIVEYTEMVSFERLIEEPFDRCGYPDAEYLGRGTYHHSEDYSGYIKKERFEAFGV